MFKIAAAGLAAVLLCSGCLLTKEDLDCWYDDMCIATNSAPAATATADGAQPLHAGR